VNKLLPVCVVLLIVSLLFSSCGQSPEPKATTETEMPAVNKTNAFKRVDRKQIKPLWLEFVQSHDCKTIEFLPNPLDLELPGLHKADAPWVDSFENRLFCIPHDKIVDWMAGYRFNPRKLQPVVKSLIGADPIRINGYIPDVVVTQGEVARFYFGAGVLTNGLNASGFKVQNIVTEEDIAAPDIAAPGQVPRAPCKRFYGSGCDYPITWDLPTNSIEPGAYAVVLTNEEGDAISARQHFFVNPKSIPQNSIAVQIPTLTMQAYNLAGGASLYRQAMAPEQYKPRLVDTQLYEVSINRPYVPFIREHHSFVVYYKLLKILMSENYNIQYIDDIDLSEQSPSLSNVKLWMMLGHSEYWTTGSGDALENYSAGSGRVLNMTGNNYYWRGILNKSGGYSLCRCAAKFAIETKEPFTNTGRITETPDFLGVKYSGYPATRKRNLDPVAQKQQDNDLALDRLKISNPSHPIFKYLDVEDGELLEASSDWIGIELDGVPLDFEGGVLEEYQSAYDFPIEILGSGYASSILVKDGKKYQQKVPIALLVDVPETKKGGHVLTFGSIGYYNALKDETGDGRKLFKGMLEYMMDDAPK